MKIEGQTIVVTGGASGIGLAMARRLLDLKADVWVLDRDREAIAEVTRTFAGNDAFHPRLCDVGDELQVARAVSDIDAASQGIDALVNNAAVLHDQALVSKLGGKIKQHSLDDWQDTLCSNLTGTFLMAREVAATMIRDKRHGVIVNISSISRAGNPGQSAYAATKAGVDALTVTWSQELACYGIRVVAIAPGFVETSMTKRIPPMFLDRIQERTPLKRFGTGDELAHALQFVLENEYVNGKTIEVDGGLRF